MTTDNLYDTRLPESAAQLRPDHVCAVMCDQTS